MITEGWMLECLHICKRIGACLGKIKLDGTVEAVDMGSLYRGYRLLNEMPAFDAEREVSEEKDAVKASTGHAPN